MRGLLPQLRAAKLNVVLLNIHQMPGSALLERFAFQTTPTYVLFAASGKEIWRSGRVPQSAQMLLDRLP